MKLNKKHRNRLRWILDCDDVEVFVDRLWSLGYLMHTHIDSCHSIFVNVTLDGGKCFSKLACPFFEKQDMRALLFRILQYKRIVRRKRKAR